jgi:hypothetical protein
MLVNFCKGYEKPAAVPQDVPSIYSRAYGLGAFRGATDSIRNLAFGGGFNTLAANLIASVL